jgi:hypothetical protein
MALPQVGGGYQIGDGNVNEVQLVAQTSPQTATATATLTVAQLTGGLLVANPSTTAASYTLPTAASLDAALANVKVDSAFELDLVNLGTGAGAVTILAGTGFTIVGNAVVAVTSSSQWLIRKTDVAAYTIYRTA